MNTYTHCSIPRPQVTASLIVHNCFILFTDYFYLFIYTFKQTLLRILYRLLLVHHKLEARGTMFGYKQTKMQVCKVDKSQIGHYLCLGFNYQSYTKCTETCEYRIYQGNSSILEIW